MGVTPAIEVRDDIRVDPVTGDATCSRSYLLTNRTSSAAAFPLPLRIGLDAEARLNAVTLQDQAAFDQVDIELGSYELTVRFFGTAQAAPGASLQLKIDYEWPAFLPKASEATYRKSVRLRHPLEFTYELSLTCSDPQFLATPAFKIMPDNCRLPPPFMTSSEDGQSFVVKTASVPPNTPLTVTIAGGHGSLSLPVLTSLGERFREAGPFANTTVVFIQHLLTDFEATISAFVRAGLDPGNAFVMGIPYSTKENVHTRLQGVFGYVPPQFEGYPFDVQLPPILDKVYEHCSARRQRFVVVEDGGYIANRFRRDPNGAKWAELCIGIVEQTRNGIRVTQDWLTAPDAADNVINVAVANVAETELKLRLESPLIGQAVVFNLQRLLSFYEEQSLSGRKALVIGGCGSTGTQIVLELLRQGCDVTVVDTRTPGPNFPNSVTYRPGSELMLALPGQDIVIGSTGNAMRYPEKDSVAPLSHEQHFAQLKDRAVLVNASSKKAEFNLDALKNIAVMRSKRGFGHERVLGEGRIVRIAADGFPINFFNSESVPSYDIQPVLGMLFLAACRLVERHPLPPGIVTLSQQDQAMIENLYNELREGR